MDSLEKSEKKDTKLAKIVDIHAVTGQAYELEDGTQVGDAEILLRIYNKLLKIEKSVA